MPPVFEKCLFEDTDILGRYMGKDREYQPCRVIELEVLTKRGMRYGGLYFAGFVLAARSFKLSRKFL